MYINNKKKKEAPLECKERAHHPKKTSLLIYIIDK